MRRELQTLILREDATIQNALQCFERTGLQSAMLCDGENRLLGLITEGDVRRALLAGHGLLSPLKPHVNYKPVLGRTSMARDELAGLLSERVRFLPVVDQNGVVQDLFLAHQRSMIPVASPSIGERELRYVTDAVLSGWVSSQGKYIGQFEQKLAAFCGTKHAAVVSNGTVALHLALITLGIGPGDEVIVPALTFVATASAVKHCGARPVFVDIDSVSWNMEPRLLEEAITPRTRAVIPVHLYGQPCRIDRIIEIAERGGLYVVEDAAEAHGAEFEGRRVGSFGHIGTFSFYGNKIITTGEGGALVTDDSDLDKKIRVLRDHGMSPERRYWHEVVGYNYRMTNLQAAIGVAQLERWDEIHQAKMRIKSFYDSHIDTPALVCAKGWEEAAGVCWLYTLMMNGSNPLSRDELLNRLRDQQVDSRPVFHPIPSMPPYYEPDWRARYPVACQVSSRGFSLPSSVELQERDIKRIARILLSIIHIQSDITTKNQ